MQFAAGSAFGYQALWARLAPEQARRRLIAGARVEVPKDAGPHIRLLGFIGRDPFWSPPRLSSHNAE